MLIKSPVLCLNAKKIKKKKTFPSKMKITSKKNPSGNEHLFIGQLVGFKTPISLILKTAIILNILMQKCVEQRQSLNSPLALGNF
jgi:hypothetical protein